MKTYFILSFALVLAACAGKSESVRTGRPDGQQPVRIHTAHKKYEVSYRQQPYRVNHILKWRTITDPKLGSKPDWDRLNRIRPGLDARTVGQLLGKPWHLGSSYLTEWNYLYRYVFGGKMQQCQYKIVFNKKTRLVEGMFWEPVGQAHCRH